MYNYLSLKKYNLFVTLQKNYIHIGVSKTADRIQAEPHQYVKINLNNNHNENIFSQIQIQLKCARNFN